MLANLLEIARQSAVLRDALVAFDTSKDAAHEELDKAKAGPPPPT